MSNVNSSYYGLMFGCPMNYEIDTCAFKDVRRMSINRRIQYFNSLSKEESSHLIERHKHCLLSRENKVPFSRIAIL